MTDNQRTEHQMNRSPVFTEGPLERYRKVHSLGRRYGRGEIGPDGFAKAVLAILELDSPGVIVKDGGAAGGSGVPPFWNNSRSVVR